MIGISETQVECKTGEKVRCCKPTPLVRPVFHNNPSFNVVWPTLSLSVWVPVNESKNPFTRLRNVFIR
jgi:hypothetical protein